jgi:branched-chain amino acid transport system ATP-binding protein
MLRVEGLTVHYGGLCALDGVSLDVAAGELVSIIGPNGAGKTTLFKSLSGTVATTSGSVTYDGQPLLDVPPPHRARRGIAHVPEGRRVFGTMTVLENLEMGAAFRKDVRAQLDEVLELFPRLAERRSQLAGTLSGGEQQMLALGRGLMSSPRLLLLDEPSMGLAPAVSDSIFERIQLIHATRDVAVLLVEQRATEALEVAARAYVLETGRIVLSGGAHQLRDDDRVRRAYLGM